MSQPPPEKSSAKVYAVRTADTRHLDRKLDGFVLGKLAPRRMIDTANKRLGHRRATTVVEAKPWSGEPQIPRPSATSFTRLGSRLGQQRHSPAPCPAPGLWLIARWLHSRWYADVRRRRCGFRTEQRWGNECVDHWRSICCLDASLHDGSCSRGRVQNAQTLERLCSKH
jgi:hypothetical protein